MLADRDVARALVVMAHPDDVDFGCAGTIAQWTDKGIEVSYCVVTDGDAGGFDPAVPRAQIPAIRQAEQRSAAEEVGVEEVVFLGYPDGRLAVSIELRADLARVIRQVRPQRLVCQSGQRNFARIGASHPDHLAAGEAALCAVYPDARNPFAHPQLMAEEGLAPHVVPEVWVTGTEQPDHWVDVTDSYHRKLAAIEAHASQRPMIDDLDAKIRGWLTANAAGAGWTDGRLAEAFRVLNTG